MSVARFDYAAFADAAAASSLAKSWASSAAVSAGADESTISIAEGPVSGSWVVTGTTDTGVGVSILVSPTRSSDGATVALSLVGSMTRSTVTIVSVSADVFAAGEAAAAAAASTSAAVAAGGAASSLELTAAAADAANSIGAALSTTPILAALASATATALEGAGDIVGAAVVRRIGVRVNVVGVSADPAVVVTTVGAISAPALKGGSAARADSTLFFIIGIVGGAALALSAFVLAYRCRQSSAGAKGDMQAALAKPTPRPPSPRRPKPKHAAVSYTDLARKQAQSKLSASAAPAAETASAVRSRAASAAASPRRAASKADAEDVDFAENPILASSQKESARGRSKSATAAARGATDFVDNPLGGRKLPAGWSETASKAGHDATSLKARPTAD